jgi:hypothetical protein
MSEPEEFNRDEVYLAQGFRTGSLRMDSSRVDYGATASPIPENGHEPPSRVMGSPLPVGSPLGASQDMQSHRAAPPPGRALSPVPAVPPADENPASTQRAMNLLTQAVPFVQKLIPLLDSTFGSAISNMLSSRPHSSGPPPNVDLTPVTNQISDLQMQHNELRSTVQEQTTGIKRVEDQLEMVREATDRNTLEQQELIEDLKNMGNKVNLFAVTLSALLLLSLVLNVILYLHIRRVLP